MRQAFSGAQVSVQLTYDDRYLSGAQHPEDGVHAPANAGDARRSDHDYHEVREPVGRRR